MENAGNGNLRVVDSAKRVTNDSESNIGKPTDHQTSSTTAQGDFNLRILLQAPARYVKEMHGVEALQRITERAGLAIDDLDGKSNWGSLGQVEAFLIGVRELVETDDEFKAACTYKMKDSIGPFRFVFQATSPRNVIEKAARNVQMTSSISRYEIAELTDISCVIRYYSKRREGRLSCLSRQAQGAMLPIIWGLPPAVHSETSCIANGDEYCEYHLRWYQHRRWLPILTGLLTGVAVATGLWIAGLSAIPLWAVLPLVGGLAGYAFELRRTNKANLKIGDEINDALRELAQDDAEARREVLDFHQRQREWSHLMEEQVAERTVVLEDVLNNVHRMQAERSSMLRGFSHDLKNPFSVIYANIDVLMSIRETLDANVRDMVEDQAEAIVQMKKMIEDMIHLAAPDAGLIRLNPEQLEVEPLVDVIRRRLRAFVHGRDIKVSVFATRETPEMVETDRLLFDRVVDNLLTNAAKYTERGSIVVELDGKPGFLTIKVSDTGRGIEQGNIEQIFQPQGSDPKRRKEGSHGVGLSVVVQLMAQIGGELEVMSLPDEGTTFWAHFPVIIRKEEPERDRKLRTPKPTQEELVGTVVKIRTTGIP